MNEDVVKQANKALSKAKIGLMTNKKFAFITNVCLNMRTEWDENIPTACTNGKVIRYNPHFFLSLSKELQLSVVVHETWHPVLKHMSRRNNRDPSRFNAAGDYVINLMMRDAGLRIGDGWLISEDYRGMSTEQVYDLLGEDTTPQWSDIEFTSNKDEAETINKELDKIILKAAIQAKASGATDSIPSEILVYLDKTLNPKLPWQEILRRYVSSIAKSDYSWQRPNKRFMPQFYLPSLHSERLNEIVVMYDLSASVTDKEIRHFTVETYKIMKQLSPKLITVVTFDTQVRDVIQVRNESDLFNIKLHGRGGTNVIDIMKWTAKHKPAVTIVFSDGQFRWTNVVDPKVPVIWAIHNWPNFSAPFGKTIQYEMEV